MRVLITGYGRMGKEIEKVLLSRGHQVAVRIDPNEVADVKDLTPEIFSLGDVVIDFSHPSSVWNNIQLYLKSGIAAVIGTTGWDAHRDEAQRLCQDTNGALLWGNNYSIGAHLFFYLVGKVAQLINNLPEYDIGVWECHHNKKADSPSGTALTVAKKIVENLPRKTKFLTTASEGIIAPDTLHVASIRLGSEFGLHEVIVDSPQDQISIRHHARGRQGFATGAVLGAEWLLGKKGFFSVEDFIHDQYFSGKE